MTTTYVRYWGSNFKRPQHTRLFSGLMRCVTEAGWRPYLVCSDPPDDAQLIEEVLETGTKIIYLPRPKRDFDYGCMWRTRQLCKSLQCDIFHCDNMHTSPLIGAALAGVPVRLWSKRSMNLAYEQVREPSFRNKLAVCIRVSSWLATRVLPISSAVKNELVGMGIHSSKCIVLPNPAEIKPFDREMRCRAREELGYYDGEIVFTTIGHAVPVKGWDVLLHAFAMVVDRFPGARLQLVGGVTNKGEREHYSLLNDYVCKCGISKYVSFRGSVSDITKVLSASDVFVLSSRSEGGPVALLEALESGLPCISTRVGSATDHIQNGVDGLLVERNNHEELANAMTSLIASPIKRMEIASAVQAKGKYSPTFSEYGEQQVEIYKSLLQEFRDC